MEERKDIQAIKTTYDAANSKTKGVKNSIAEQKLLQKQKQAAYRASLTKSTTRDPHTGATYTSLTDKEGNVKDVSTEYQSRMVHLNENQQKMLQRNIETAKMNQLRQSAHQKQAELHGKDSKQYKAVTEAAPISKYETVIPGFTPNPMTNPSHKYK
tara:strand:- start:242 stop:709 length:468 start_codon:yes stop_codon:yes gene_type:complete